MLTPRDKRYLLKLKEKIVTKCLKCKGQDISCSCLDDYRLEFKKVKAAIPPKYRKFTFDRINHPETVQVRKQIQNYINNLEDNIVEGKGLFLYGSTGLAKSSLACVVLIEALRKNITGHFLTLEQCISLYVGRWRKDDLKQQFDDIILNTDVLVIDEVGNEARTNVQFVSSCFNDIIRQRSNNLAATILTSNMSFAQIKNSYGDVIYSILHECCIPLEFKGVDFREGITNV